MYVCMYVQVYTYISPGRLVDSTRQYRKAQLECSERLSSLPLSLLHHDVQPTADYHVAL